MSRYFLSLFKSSLRQVSDRYLIYSIVTVGAVYLGSSCGIDADSDGDGYYAIESIRGTRYFDCEPADPKINIGIPYYKDADSDGFGDSGQICYLCSEDEADSPPCIPADASDEELSINYIAKSGDCDDSNSEISSSIFLFPDTDNDSFGEAISYDEGAICVSEVYDPETWFKNIEQKPAYVQNLADCDDLETVVFYLDVDRDTYGRDDVVFYSCNPDEIALIRDTAGSMLVERGGDCNDGDITKDEEANLAAKAIHPGLLVDCSASRSTEEEPLTNGDDDCDGSVNEDETFFFRDDELQNEVKKGDGYGDRNNFRFECSSALDMATQGYKPITALKGFDCDAERYDETNGGFGIGTTCTSN